MLNDPLKGQLAHISAHSFTDETEAVNTLLESLESTHPLEARIKQRAKKLARALREDGSGNGVEAFLHEYGLDTSEGIAVMCLAEALLRIPDSETADRLIRDKFEGTEWEKHLGKSESLFVNASSWGLLLTGKVVNFSRDNAQNILKKLVGRTGEPVIRESLRAAMRFMGHTFVMGETIDKAIKNAKPEAKQGYTFSYDMLGEGARTEAQARGYLKAYSNSIQAIGKAAGSKDMFAADSISIKLSALHPRYWYAQKDRVMAELLPRLAGLMKEAKQVGIMVAIDAEEATRLDIELELYAALLEEPELKDWNGVGFVVQAYQKRAPYVIDYLIGLAKKHDITIPVRLVKGAYWDTEIKLAQVMGLAGYPVFTQKEHTDICYVACAQKMLEAGDALYPQFATHNARTVASIIEMAGEKPYEFQRLHGMGEKLHDMLVEQQIPSRVYAPVGRHKDLLAYLIRRLLENGANTSFVNLLMDQDITLDTLLANPADIARSKGCQPNHKIPLPKHIYGDRTNSGGVDFGSRIQMEDLLASVASYGDKQWAACPTGAFTAPSDLPKQEIFSPAALNECVGEVTEASDATVDAAMKRASEAFPSWSNTPVEQRAAMLEKAADALEAQMDELLAMLAREAGKTLPDGVAEVREAADFCRYYALHATQLMQQDTLAGPTGESNDLHCYPRGVFVCISPWNFPLAIFAGQVVAALATGNCVLAKPAEQTPLIAQRMIDILHEAGVPKGAVQLLPGDGKVGAAMTAHPDIAGVVFTGSGEVAQKINQTLAQRDGPIIPLIAETGGLNCMVVDSSALLETALDDIILSAFGSAGQRCSALRVLLVQDEIADEMITLIEGAMAELKLGRPGLLSTDVGPVIDKDAHAMLEAHIEKMKKDATFIAASKLTDEQKEAGHFIAPHAFEIDRLNMLEKEVFGPVLHVLRYKAGDFEKLPAMINATGYGLTFGVHSRIEDHAEFLSQRVRAGNIYINRSMIGATVGVQPFGGEGLSGTGPKAGGPHYLTRFITERTITNNTAAMGGNVTLLA